MATIGRNPYVISMDGYVSHHNLNTLYTEDLIKPLWYPRSDDYVEFEAYTNNNFMTQTKSDFIDPISSVNKYKCHVCNKEVPRAYIKEHHESDKHQICTKIADIALSRVRDQFHQAVTVPHVQVRRTDAYFCGTCAAVIPSQDKCSHELTTSHIKALKYDFLLKKLLDVYVEGTEAKMDDFHSLFNGVNKIEMQDKKVATENVLESHSENLVSNELDEKKHESDILMGVATTDSGPESILKPNPESENIDQPDKVIVTTTVLDVTDQSVKIEKKKKSKKKKKTLTIESSSSSDSCPTHNSVTTTPIDNTDITIGETNIEMITNNNNIEPVVTKTQKLRNQDSDEEYVEFVLENKNIRVSADNFHGLTKNDGLVFCLLCGDFVDDVESHKGSETHLRVLALPLRGEHCLRQIDGIWVHCIVCNEIIDETHVNDIEHNTKLNESCIETKLNKKHTEGRSVANDKFTYCVSCKIYIDSHNFNSHLSGAKHKNNYKKNFPEPKQYIAEEAQPEVGSKNKEWYIESVGNTDESKCNICKLILKDADIKTHVIGTTHYLKFKELIVKNNIKTTYNGYFCEMCNEVLDKYEILEHLQCSEHERLLNSSKNSECSRKQPECSSKPAECSSKPGCSTAKNIPEAPTFCNICNTRVTEPMAIHTASLSHKTNQKMFANHLKKQQVSHKLLELEYHLKPTKNEKVLFCKICNTDVPNVMTNYIEHVKGNTHTCNYNNLISSNKLIKIAFCTYHCEYCKVNLPSKTEVDHVSNTTHKNKMTPNCEAKQHYCKTCKVKVPNNMRSVVEHENGAAHIGEFERLMRSNNIFREGQKLYCKHCNMHLDCPKLSEHICSVEHLANFTMQAIAGVLMNKS